MHYRFWGLLDSCLAAEEDLEPAVKDLMRLPNSFALPAAWPSNKMAQEAVAHHIEAMENLFPLRILNPVYFVHSINELTANKLGNPSSPVRNAARRLFDQLAALYEEHGQTIEAEAVD